MGLTSRFFRLPLTTLSRGQGRRRSTPSYATPRQVIDLPADSVIRRRDCPLRPSWPPPSCWAARAVVRPASSGCLGALGHAHLRKCRSLWYAMRQVIGRELARFSAVRKPPTPTVFGDAADGGEQL